VERHWNVPAVWLLELPFARYSEQPRYVLQNSPQGYVRHDCCAQRDVRRRVLLLPLVLQFHSRWESTASRRTSDIRPVCLPRMILRAIDSGTVDNESECPCQFVHTKVAPIIGRSSASRNQPGWFGCSRAKANRSELSPLGFSSIIMRDPQVGRILTVHLGDDQNVRN